MSIFHRFQNVWAKINSQNYRSGKNPLTCEKLQNSIENILEF
jgi:hypothetical protein